MTKMKPETLYLPIPFDRYSGLSKCDGCRTSWAKYSYANLRKCFKVMPMKWFYCERCMKKLRAAQPKLSEPEMCYWHEYGKCDKQAYFCFCLKHWRDEKAEVANDEIRTIMLTYESRLKECEAKARAEGMAQGKKEEREAFKASFGWAADVKYWLVKRAELDKEAQKQVKE